MCGLHAYEKENDKQTDATECCGGITLSSNYTINPLVYLCVSIKFIDTWTCSISLCPICSHSMVCCENDSYLLCIKALID